MLLTVFIHILMPTKMKFNRGDVAEGILGAALTAKFMKRPPGDKARVFKYPEITKKDIDAVLDDFFRSGKPLTNEVKDITRQKKRIVDQIIFSIALPAQAFKLLQDKKARKELVDDLYESSIAYVEKEWSEDVEEFYMNGTPDTIQILSDGTGDQKGTKADIKMIVNGK